MEESPHKSVDGNVAVLGFGTFLLELAFAGKEEAFKFYTSLNPTPIVWVIIPNSGVEMEKNGRRIIISFERKGDDETTIFTKITVALRSEEAALNWLTTMAEKPLQLVLPTSAEVARQSPSWGLSLARRGV